MDVNAPIATGKDERLWRRSAPCRKVVATSRSAWPARPVSSGAGVDNGVGTDRSEDEMYERILVATDGSTRANDAVRRATELATAIGLEELHVVSSCRPYTLDQLERARSELPVEFRDLVDAEIEAEHHLAEARTVIARAGLRAVEHVATGQPADAILRTATDLDADLIVVGARGLSAVARFVRGSVSTKVAHHSTCDVLIVEHDD